MKRHNVNQLVTALVVVAAGVAIAGIVAAQGGPGAKGSPRPVAQAAAASLPSCPSATICAFSGPDATGTEFSFPTAANHSQWIAFEHVSQADGTPFDPNSIINNSGSDIWIYDAEGGEVAGPYCALATTLRAYTFSDWLPIRPIPPTPSPEYTPQGYTPGWFFINYNVNTCVGPAATPFPS